MSETAVFTVNLNTPLGQIQGKFAINTGPMRLAELVPPAMELTNVLVRRAITRQEEAGKSVSCRAGCGMCCRQLVLVSGPEAFYLMDMIASLDQASQASLCKRFEELRARLKNHGMIEELKNPVYSEESKSFPISEKYFKQGLPCPLLVDESCSIHPNRPIPCRDYNVTSPASMCANPYSNLIQKVPMPLALTAAIAKLTASLTDDKMRLIPLSLSPDWVGQNQELNQKYWPGLELFKRFLDIVGESLQTR